MVTGAAGFLGFYIARRLASSKDNHVVCVDNFIRGESDHLYEQLLLLPNVEHLTVDLNEQGAVRAMPRDIDVIFHMAALNGTQNFYERPFDVVKCCTLPTLNLIEHFGLSNINRFVYAGTSEAYASTVARFGWPVPTSEDVPLAFDDVFNPRWSYGASKMHGEIATINGCRHFSIPFTVIRFHNAYGPRMGDKHVVPDFYGRARRSIFELYGYEDTRSFIYAEDAARATIELARSADAEGQVVNVGGGDEVTIEYLGELMMRAAKLDGKITLFPSPQGSVKRRAPDLSKLRRLIGYVPSVDLEEGLLRTAEFYMNDVHKF